MLSWLKVRNQTGSLFTGNSWQHSFQRRRRTLKTSKLSYFLSPVKQELKCQKNKQASGAMVPFPRKICSSAVSISSQGSNFPERSIILVLAKFSPWKMEDKKLTINFCHRRNRDNKQDPAELGENQNETAFEVWTSVFVWSICIPDRTHGS